VRKVRLTGGEPLVRRDLDGLVALLRDVPGVEDISLTTNGVLLEGRARELAAAGLRRVNVSLESLDPARYERLTRRALLHRVLAGLSAARVAGLSPIKVNAVLMRGVNDDEAEPLVERARDEGWELRFIEFMPLSNGEWDPSRVVGGAELRRRIGTRWPIEPVSAGDPHAPATRYRFLDGRGHVGFIDSVSRPFCSSCSRLRLTSDGQLRVCLYGPGETDLKTPLRSGATDAEVEALIERAVAGKGRGGALEILERKAAPTPVRTMHQIGG
jgi:cyclic pyranopterin phosphate synthase